MYLSTCVLILLQRDLYVLKHHSRNNNLTPTISAAFFTLTIATCRHSDVWVATHWWYQLVAAMEFCSALSTLPVLFIFTTILWNERFYINDRTVVFLTPLYSVLILTGSSYTSWVLSIVGIGVGWWMMSEKLPLER